jgi:hypothetical protein
MVRKLLVVAFLLIGNLAAANGKPAEARNEDVPKGPAVPQTDPKPQSGQQTPTGSVRSPKGGDTKSTPSGSVPGGGGKGSAPAK